MHKQPSHLRLGYGSVVIMMALSATSRDGIQLQSGFPQLVGPQAILQGLRGPAMPNLVGTSLMGLGADGTPDLVTPGTPAGVSLIGLITGALVTGGITAWMFSASRDGSNVKPGLVAGGTYLAGGLLILALAR